jgi:hypothetical protein
MMRWVRCIALSFGLYTAWTGLMLLGNRVDAGELQLQLQLQYVT